MQTAEMGLVGGLLANTNIDLERNMDEDTPSTEVRGTALILAVQEEAKRQSLSVSELAERFELATSYWFSICNGNRSIQALARHRLKLIAKFLARPYIEILSMAELVEPEDFIVPQTIDDQLNLAYIRLQSDSMWSPLVPNEETWDAADRRMKILAIALYERVFNVSMFEKANIIQYQRTEHAASEIEATTPAVSPLRPSSAKAIKSAKSARSKKATAAAA